MRYDKFIKISNTLEEGFFADRVVKTLNQETILGKEEEEILKKVLDYLKRIESGRLHVSTGKLNQSMSTPLKDIEAYQKAIFNLEVTTENEEEFWKKFNKKIEEMKEEAEFTLKNKKIEPPKVKNILKFFDIISTETLFEGSRHLEPEVPEWMKPLSQ